MNYDDKYLEYAKILAEVSEMESSLSNKKRLLNDIKSELTDEQGSFGLELSAHAIANISSRLEMLANENSKIYKDVMNRENPHKSIIWHSNMKAFIIGILANANKKGEFEEKESKNRPDHMEIHFSIEINKWSDENKRLIFVGIVESNIVKTGYFNWEDKSR